MTDTLKCARGLPPVVRLSLHKVKCPRATSEINNSPERILQYVQREYGCMPQEYMLVLAMSSSMEVLTIIEASVGAVAQALVDPKVVFPALLLSGATGFILIHNHPSGDPSPSDADVQLTRQFREGGRILGLQLIDHMVIGAGNGYRSFQAMGLLARL